MEEKRNEKGDWVTPEMLANKKTKEEIIGSLRYRVLNKLQGKHNNKMKIGSYLPTEPENLKGMLSDYI
jgi:hypothetical protein